VWLGGSPKKMAQTTKDPASEDLVTLASDQAASQGLSAMAHCLQIGAPLRIYL
jgi:hypothetical protein